MVYPSRSIGDANRARSDAVSLARRGVPTAIHIGAMSGQVWTF